MINFDINEITRYNLKRLLEEKNVSQAELAERIGTEKPYVSNLLSDPGSKGHRNIGKRIAHKISKALNVPVFELYVFDLSKKGPYKSPQGTTFSPQAISQYPKTIERIVRDINEAAEDMYSLDVMLKSMVRYLEGELIKADDLKKRRTET